MKKLSLTFDDGPSQSTLALLQVLHTHKAPATFFQIGQYIERGNSAVAQVNRIILADGHELGNHSQHHNDLRDKSYKEIFKEVNVRDIRLHKYFRPPYGFYDEKVQQVVKDLGLKFVLWTVDSFDYCLDTVGAILHQVNEQIDMDPDTDAILLFHDGDSRDPAADRSATVHAVKLLIPYYRDLGYEFVPLEQTTLPGTPRKTSL